MRFKKCVTFIPVLLIPLLLFADGPDYSYFKVKPRKKTSWSFGINLGTYFANKYNANFYNGSLLNENKISLVFDNYYYKQDIRRELNDTFYLAELPEQMRYAKPFYIGFYFNYNFIRDAGIMFQINYCKLRTNDYFTMLVGPPTFYLTEDDIRLYPIWGTEERFSIDLGVNKRFLLDKYIYFITEGGFNLNNTRVRENKIGIGNLTYSLINIYGDNTYVPNVELQENYIRQGGLGFGGFIGGGFKFEFSETISVDPMMDFYWNKTNLTGYKRFKFDYSLMVRLCIADLFSKKKNDSSDE